MTTEWIDIVDTSVKIGLGALISGSFTYLGLKHKTVAEKDKFKTENKFKLLEESSISIHEYFISWRYYGSIVSGITKTKKANSTEQTHFSEKQLENLKDKETKLVES